VYLCICGGSGKGKKETCRSGATLSLSAFVSFLFHVLFMFFFFFSFSRWFSSLFGPTSAGLVVVSYFFPPAMSLSIYLPSPIFINLRDRSVSFFFFFAPSAAQLLTEFLLLFFLFSKPVSTPGTFPRFFFLSFPL
jgi:hypothetical protein